MVGLLGNNINSYYRTSVTKNCRAPGLIGCAPGLKYLDTPASGIGPVCVVSGILFKVALLFTSNLTFI